MTEPKRSIFRANAVRRYVEVREEVVSPTFVSPPTRACLGILAVVLAWGGVVAGLTPIPQFVSGCARAVDRSGSSDGALVVFLPSEALSLVHPGQTLLLQPRSGGALRPRSVLSVEPAPVGPMALRERFGLEESASLVHMSPAAVALASVEATEEVATDSGCGSGYSARVQVGWQRAVSVVPLIGRWFAQEGL